MGDRRLSQCCQYQSDPDMILNHYGMMWWGPPLVPHILRSVLYTIPFPLINRSRVAHIHVSKLGHPSLVPMVTCAAPSHYIKPQWYFFLDPWEQISPNFDQNATTVKEMNLKCSLQITTILSQPLILQASNQRVVKLQQKTNCEHFQHITVYLNRHGWLLTLAFRFVITHPWHDFECSVANHQWNLGMYGWWYLTEKRT